MFPYQDPTGTKTLETAGALEGYRAKLHSLYTSFGGLPGSAFAILEAFDELAPGTTIDGQTVDWIGFPRRLQNEAAGTIDRARLRMQEEYVEWRVEHDGGGRLTRVTFTTEFTEYFEALAEVGSRPLKEEVARLVPGAQPTDAELFGPLPSPDARSPEARRRAFLRQLPDNPWNNGEQGILCLTHGSNTLGALLGLCGACSVPRTDIPAGSMCDNVGGSCVPGRNSDPVVCSTLQEVARSGLAFSLEDPAGIVITRMDGIWTLDGAQIGDINDPAVNRGLWGVSRGGHRGKLEVPQGLTLNGAAVTSGAQVAQVLRVGTRVRLVPDAALPFWARLGNEGVRGRA